MYLDAKNRKGKIGKVSISYLINKYRIRWTFPAKNRNKLRIDCSLDEIVRIAKLIQRDLELGDCDLTYQRYLPKSQQAYQQRLEIVEKLPNLAELFEKYKEANQLRVSDSVKKTLWDWYENKVLKDTPTGLLEINRATEFCNHLLTRYSVGTVRGILKSPILPSVNLAIEQG